MSQNEYIFFNIINHADFVIISYTNNSLFISFAINTTVLAVLDGI